MFILNKMFRCKFCDYETYSMAAYKKHQSGFQNNYEHCLRCHICLNDFSSKQAKQRHLLICKKIDMDPMTELWNENKKIISRLNHQESRIARWNIFFTKQKHDHDDLKSTVSNLRRAVSCLTTRVRNMENILSKVTDDYAKKSWVLNQIPKTPKRKSPKSVKTLKPPKPVETLKPVETPKPVKTSVETPKPVEILKPVIAPKRKSAPTYPFLSVYCELMHPSGRTWGMIYKKLVRVGHDVINRRASKLEYEELVSDVKLYPGPKFIPDIPCRIVSNERELVRINYIFETFLNFSAQLTPTSGCHMVAAFIKCLLESNMIALSAGGTFVKFNGYIYRHYKNNSINEISFTKFVTMLIDNCKHHICGDRKVDHSSVMLISLSA